MGDNLRTHLSSSPPRTPTLSPMLDKRQLWEALSQAQQPEDFPKFPFWWTLRNNQPTEFCSANTHMYSRNLTSRHPKHRKVNWSQNTPGRGNKQKINKNKNKKKHQKHLKYYAVFHKQKKYDVKLIMEFVPKSVWDILAQDDRKLLKYSLFAIQKKNVLYKLQKEKSFSRLQRRCPLLDRHWQGRL